jgi:hypothetical protein
MQIFKTTNMKEGGFQMNVLQVCCEFGVEEVDFLGHRITQEARRFENG